MATIRLFGGADAGGASEALQVGEQLLFEFESVEIVVTRKATATSCECCVTADATLLVTSQVRKQS